ncbi:MAG: alpha/beta fold hydrolase [Myxococcaceae bacterium]
MFAALAVLLGLWLLVVGRMYRLRRPPPTPVEVTASDGWRLRMYHRVPAVQRFEEPVLLCHGLAANHRNLDFDPPWSVAHALADAGFHVFSVDWRGTGGSRGSPQGVHPSHYDFDDFVRQDAPAFLREALARTGARRAFWLGHSLGGLVGYATAQGPTGTLIAGIVSLGSPAVFGYPRLYRHLLRMGHLLSWPWRLRQRWFSFAAAPFLGHLRLPLTDVVYNPEHIPPAQQRKLAAQIVTDVGRRLLLQFDDWIECGAFRSYDGREDYRAGLTKIRVPLLITGGSSDRLAPVEVVKEVFDRAGSEDKALLIFGTDSGDALDYGHGDLIFGAGAPTEVYPRIVDWLQTRATAVPASAGTPEPVRIQAGG